MKEKMKVRVWRLGWNGMEKVTITVAKLDKALLKVSDWFFSKVGQLCINDKGNLDVCKEISFVPPRDPFKGYNRYTFKYSNGSVSESMVHRVDVKKGKKFKFRGKIFLPL